jgi:flagellar motor switch protein FliM
MQTGERDEKLAARWSDQLRDAVSDSELEVVAQLATLRVSALDLASIQPGDTLWFKPPASVKVLVQSAHLFDAEYGTADGNVAVRIERVIEPPAENKDASDSADAQTPEQTEEAARSAAIAAKRRKQAMKEASKTAGASAA